MNPKLLITPIQQWLLLRHRCTTCGKLLDDQPKHRKNGVAITTCTCHKIFLYHFQTDTYQHTPSQEIAVAEVNHQ